MHGFKEVVYNHIENYLQGQEMFAKVCEVIEVDQDNYTIVVSPIDGSADIENVRLKPTIGGIAGMVFIPVVDTKCVVVFESKITAFMLMADEVEMVLLRDGENGGLINVVDLVSKVNSLENAHNTHIHITTATIGSSGTPGTIAPTTTTVTLTQVGDIEDNKILH